MDTLIFRPEPFRFAPIERDIDTLWYSDRGGAVTRGRKLQQKYTRIKIIRRPDNTYQVEYSNKLPTSSTYPFDDTAKFDTEAAAQKRAAVLRAYGYVVKPMQRSSDRKWYCHISRVVPTTGPALPTTTGIDTGFFYDLKDSAKRRAAALAAVGFSVSVFERADKKWQVKITKLPTYVASTTTASSSSSSPSGSTTSSTPNKLEVINAAEPAHKLSDAVVQNFRDFAADVRAVTDVALDAGFGDTVRSLGTKGSSTKASDTFTWHKTGRAVDIDQNKRWVIIEETTGGDTYFRLYLRHKDLTTTAGVKKFPSGTTFHSAFWSTVSPNWPFVDVTAIAASHGFHRIKAQTGWGTSGSAYNKQEWWHYEKRDGLNWFQALQQIYTDAQIKAGLGSILGRNKDSNRLRTEGFTDAALQNLFPAIKKGRLELHCPVGKASVNLAKDVREVQRALIRGGKLTAGTDTGTLDTNTQTAIDTFQGTFGAVDGVISVGLKTHQELGKL